MTTNLHTRIPKEGRNATGQMSISISGKNKRYSTLTGIGLDETFCFGNHGGDPFGRHTFPDAKVAALKA